MTHPDHPVRDTGNLPPESASVATSPSPEILNSVDLADAWPILDPSERVQGLSVLPRPQAEDFFLALTTLDQTQIVLAMPPGERRSWLRLLPPDDAADLMQAAPANERPALLELLDVPTRNEVAGLLTYAEDQAGGLMNPRYARLRPEMSVEEAISYLRRYARAHRDGSYYAYVLDGPERLVGVVTFRELFAAAPEEGIADIMRREPVTVPEHLDQEEVGRLFAAHHFYSLPVVDAGGRMKGIVTIDDVVDVVREEATEDIQKSGGMAALDAPYLAIGFTRMTRKRAGWLAALFLGEMLTATAMGRYEDEIAQAVVLALFVPLIISSGGNSGSQASTLVIRAMALGELRLRDWWRVVRRELAAGVVLGSILAVIGLARIVMWQGLFHVYGEHYLLIAATVALTLVGVVTFGTLAGSMLPFVLRRLGFDPASASAPFVATLVDVTGLIIYFSVAKVILRGTLL